MRLAAIVVITTLAVALGFAACGKSDQDQIENAITEATTTSDPENCTELQTQRFVEQTQYDVGPQAVLSCRQSSGDQPIADSVKVTRIEVSGDKATAGAKFTGGAFDRQTLILSLVKDDGDWKLDRIDDIPGFSASLYSVAFVRQSQRGTLSLRPKPAACISRQIRKQPDLKLKRAILSGNQQRLAPIFRPCL